ncbi:MAG TPA: M1 family aminopeptidase [Balneolales bacterium]|nr:M1 family aminopeptidase [Balneolales bacterium]
MGLFKQVYDDPGISNLTIMKRNRYLLLVCAFLLSVNGYAQNSLPVSRTIQNAYQKGTRSEKGIPGPDYWQNHADYSIDVNFIPATRLLSGTEHITYTNNSRDTLRRIWFKLYPDLYKEGGARAQSIKPEDVSKGVQIQKLIIDGTMQDAGIVHTRGTNMWIPVKPLLPGKKMTFIIHFSYVLNKKSQIRTGEIEPGSYFIAYFYPTIAVYDDIDGWNRIPYTGLQEFYNDFNNFDVRITVPQNYVVWATGTLQHPENDLNKKYVDRLEEAEKNNAITSVIDSTDLKKGDITLQNPINSWHFVAKNVTEFVFATSNHYVWESSSLVVDPKTGRRTRVDAAFNPKHKDYYDVIDFARKTVKAMSYDFPKWPYPYPHETIFDGLSQMEYPMMVNDNPLQDHAESIELTDHEIFHTMFPFYMGTNETRYAFMDEGWATIGEWIISPIIDSTLVDKYGMNPYDHLAGTDIDLPIMTPSQETSGTTYYLNSYPKPAMGYLYVRDMLGDKLFTKGLHYYIEQWHGKHPMPYDFFYSMNKGTGKNLNWFWKRWFFDNGYPDQAIDNVSHHGNRYRVTVKSVGSKPVPVDLTVVFPDNSTKKIHRTIAVWKKGNKTVTLTFKTGNKPAKIVLGGTYDADTNPDNNVYTFK